MTIPAFDPNNPFDVVAERFRKEICDVAAKMLDDPDYVKLGSIDQLQAFMAGALVAVIGCCFAHIRQEGRDEMMFGLVSYLPQARAQAEAIAKDAARQTN